MSVDNLMETVFDTKFNEIKGTLDDISNRIQNNEKSTLKQSEDIGNLRDMVKLGQLYLQVGFSGSEQILSSNWIDKATSAQTNTGCVYPTNSLYDCSGDCVNNSDLDALCDEEDNCPDNTNASQSDSDDDSKGDDSDTIEGEYKEV